MELNGFVLFVTYMYVCGPLEVIVLVVRDHHILSIITPLLVSLHSIQSVGPLTALSMLQSLFIPAQTRPLWEAFSHAAITVRILFAYVSTAVYSQVLFYTAE